MEDPDFPLIILSKKGPAITTIFEVSEFEKGVDSQLLISLPH